jgi:hypothetical protein
MGHLPAGDCVRQRGWDGLAAVQPERNRTWPDRNW